MIKSNSSLKATLEQSETLKKEIKKRLESIKRSSKSIPNSDDKSFSTLEINLVSRFSSYSSGSSCFSKRINFNTSSHSSCNSSDYYDLSKKKDSSLLSLSSGKSSNYSIVARMILLHLPFDRVKESSVLLYLVQYLKFVF